MLADLPPRKKFYPCNDWPRHAAGSSHTTCLHCWLPFDEVLESHWLVLKGVNISTSISFISYVRLFRSTYLGPWLGSWCDSRVHHIASLVHKRMFSAFQPSRSHVHRVPEVCPYRILYWQQTPLRAWHVRIPKFVGIRPVVEQTLSFSISSSACRRRVFSIDTSLLNWSSVFSDSSWLFLRYSSSL